MANPVFQEIFSILYEIDRWEGSCVKRRPINIGVKIHTGVKPPEKTRLTTGKCEDEMLNYCANLSSVLADVHRQVKGALAKPNPDALHDLRPGEWIVVKDFRRKSWKAKRWQGPFQILLTTLTAVKIAERATWIHASHCKRVPVLSQDSGDISRETVHEPEGKDS